MIRRGGYETERAAQREALSLLSEYRHKEGLQYSEVETETNRYVCKDGTIRPYIIKDSETGALAAIYVTNNRQGDEDFSVIFVAPEEADKDNRTYPFRDVIEDRIPFILFRRVSFFKPLIPIPVDEALTAEAAKRLEAFFIPMFGNLDGLGTEEEIGELTKELAISEYKKIYPYPETLAQITGEETDSVDKYVRSFSKMLGEELSEEEAEEIRNYYLYKAADHLRKWITYEFFRTESYSHLKETVLQAKELLHPYEESEDVRNLLGTEEEPTAINYAIAQYMGKDANFTRLEHSIEEIAEYIEAPVGVVYKANTAYIY